MNEEFEKWFENIVNDNLHRPIACEHLFLDRDEFLVGCEGAWTIQQANIDAQAKELEALRGFAESIKLINFDRLSDGAYANRIIHSLFKLYGLIDKNGNPTPLLTGVSDCGHDWMGMPK
jgi:hypothetical protein